METDIEHMQMTTVRSFLIRRVQDTRGHKFSLALTNKRRRLSVDYRLRCFQVELEFYRCVLLYLKASNVLENWKLVCVMPLHVGEAKPWFGHPPLSRATDQIARRVT
jgi:hypothetical protein